MSDLAKLVNDIRSLSKAEADQLIGLLATQWGPETGSTAEEGIDDMKALSEEDWLVAEAISLKAQAAALSRSLDETLVLVSSRCAAILEVASWPGSKRS